MNCARAKAACPKARLQLETVLEQMALTRNACWARWSASPEAAAALESTRASRDQKRRRRRHPAGRPAGPPRRRRRRALARRGLDQGRGQCQDPVLSQHQPRRLCRFSSIGLGNLMDSGSRQWGVGPALRLPIFDAGRLRANLRGKTADLDAAVESYNAAVIDAVRDVADQVASSQAITRQQTEQRAAQDAAESAYDIAVQRYKAGLGNYLNVLHGGNQRAGPAPAGGGPVRPRAGHAGGVDTRAGRRLHPRPGRASGAARPARLQTSGHRATGDQIRSKVNPAHNTHHEHS